jgi:glucose/arabinose dehydrogenase
MSSILKKLTFGTVFIVVGVTAAIYFTAGDTAKLAEETSMGSIPALPDAKPPILPTVKIAPAKGWTDGAEPKAADGLRVNSYATGMDHPRWLYVLPNGDVLVAETNGPTRPDDGRGLKSWVMHLLMEQAGAGVQTANRISLLRDANHDGTAEKRTTFLSGLNSPFGMALISGNLYVANTDAILRFPYLDGETEIAVPGVKIADLPAGPINHHWTKGLLASQDGKHLYVSVGSNSNIGENGIEKEESRAAIHEIDLASGKTRIFASGLRNPVGLAWQVQSNELWAVVNERDELGSDLVPDYLTSVKDGGFYGWPYSYYGSHIDSRITPQQPDLVAKAIIPDYALGNHVAPLGLTFSEGSALTERFKSGAFIGEHGSWNRNPPSGYKVVFVSFVDGKPAGKPLDVLTGFRDGDGNALGRPVGVTIAGDGALLIADDVGNTIWRVIAAPEKSAAMQ